LQFLDCRPTRRHHSTSNHWTMPWLHQQQPAPLWTANGFELTGAAQLLRTSNRASGCVRYSEWL